MRHHTARLRWGVLALALLLALSASACGDDDDDGGDAGSDQTTEATDDAGAGTTSGAGPYDDDVGSDDSRDQGPELRPGPSAPQRGRTGEDPPPSQPLCSKAGSWAGPATTRRSSRLGGQPDSMSYLNRGGFSAS